MRSMRTSGFLAILAVLLAACASTGGGDGTRGSDLNTVTAEEIAPLDVSTAYEVVERLRPRWLRVRSPRSHARSTEIIVVVDDLQLGGPDVLRDIDASNIRVMRWLDSAQAGQLPGLGSRHIEGAIVIETR